MTSAPDYFAAVSTYFGFLEAEFHFKLMEQTANGNAFYSCRYRKEALTLAISYENVEDHLTVTLYPQPGVPDSLTLAQLNQQYMPGISPEAKQANHEAFATCSAATPLERSLLKQAKDLRLLLGHALLRF